MQQLPHKARALEERLYKTSPSLESYLDRSTLKNRLKKVAVLITTQYKESAKGRKLSKTSRGSSSSFSIPWVGGGATTRDSVSSNMGPPRSVSVGAGGNVSQRSSFASNNGTKQNTMPVGQESAGLSKQKAVNEELQRQILANIRQQQHLVHSTRQGSSEVSRNDNNGSNEPGGLQQGSISEIGRRSSSGQMLQSNHQFSNMQQNPFNSNIQQQNGQMVNSMMGNPMNDMQGNQLTNRNMQGNMMHQMGSNSLGMGDAAFSTQTSLMRHTSAPESSSGSNFSPAQMAMMRQQSVPVPNGSNGMNMPMHMQNAATMQATFMRQQNSSDTPSSLQQQQQQQQQAALMRQMPNPQNQREAAAFAQMQATMMGQAQGAPNGQFNTIGQSDAFLMRQNSGQMNPQAQGAMMRQMSESSQQFSQSGNAAMQADMMRRTSFGNNQNLLSPNGGSSFGPNSTIMNQQIGNIGTTMLPNGQVVPTHMLQSNPVLLQQMNAVNMQQNFQQPQMMNNMTIMQGQNPGNFNVNDRSNGQSNKSGDDSDFNW